MSHLRNAAVSPRTGQDPQSLGTPLVAGIGQTAAKWLVETRIFSMGHPHPECSLIAGRGQEIQGSLSGQGAESGAVFTCNRKRAHWVLLLPQPPSSWAEPQCQEVPLGLLGPLLSTRRPSFLLGLTELMASRGLSWCHLPCWELGILFLRW